METTLLLTIGDNYSWLLPAQNVHRYLDHGWSLDSCIARLQNSIPAHCLLSLNSALPTPLRILQITRTEVELSPLCVWLLFHQRVSVVSNIKIEKPLCCRHAALTSISDENIIDRTLTQYCWMGYLISARIRDWCCIISQSSDKHRAVDCTHDSADSGSGDTNDSLITRINITNTQTDNQG